MPLLCDIMKTAVWIQLIHYTTETVIREAALEDEENTPCIDIT